MSQFLANILEGINSVVHNYGWSVVLFTLLIRLIVLPFDYKSRVGMRKTQKIQPELNRLQKKYANDQNKLNQKMSELYKKEGVSPLSSCLPMLITMPVLFAMFAAMRMVANQQVVSQVLSLLHGNEPVLEGWLWIKNIWMPDSPFTSFLPSLDMMRQVSADVWQKMITGDELTWLINTYGLSADPFTNANLQGTIAALSNALQETSFYANSGIIPGWTFNLIFAQFSIYKDWNGLFILPLVAAGSQFLMTKLTGSTPAAGGNEQQQQAQQSMQMMNWFFPLFSLWICAGYNASFSIYWVVANLIAIVENVGINKFLDMKEAKQANKDDIVGGGSVK